MFIECRHILPRGTKCKSPALRGKVYCYFHDRMRRFEQDGQRDEREPLFLPSIEDARGVQMAITQILAALGSGRVDSRKAGLYLYGLQLATQLLAQLPEPAPQEMVRSLAVGADGNYIAAEETPEEIPPLPPASTPLADAPLADVTLIDIPVIEGHDRSSNSGAAEKLQLDKPDPVGPRPGYPDPHQPALHQPDLDQTDLDQLWPAAFRFDHRTAESLLDSEPALH